MKTVLAAGINFRVFDRGRGTPILLVHGFPLNHSMWTHQIEWLAEARRVIAPDLRGFGGSEVTPGTVTMEQFADDLAGLLDALEVAEPVVLCGLSMGGYVAWQFWRKHAERLRAMVLCDTRAKADSPEAVKGRLKMIEQVLQHGPQVVAEAMLPKLFSLQAFEYSLGVTEFARQIILGNSAEGIAAALRGMAGRPDVTEWLPRIAVPALLVVGEHDAISPVEEMRGIAQAMPRAELAVIPQAGHLSPLENPEQFNGALARFLVSQRC